MPSSLGWILSASPLSSLRTAQAQLFVTCSSRRCSLRRPRHALGSFGRICEFPHRSVRPLPQLSTLQQQRVPPLRALPLPEAHAHLFQRLSGTPAMPQVPTVKRGRATSAAALARRTLSGYRGQQKTSECTRETGWFGCTWKCELSTWRSVPLAPRCQECQYLQVRGRWHRPRFQITVARLQQRAGGLCRACVFVFYLPM